jgi:hypothetical protein
MNFPDFIRQEYLSAGEHSLFRVDDESPADKSPCFCNITVRIDKTESIAFDLILTNAPWDEHVENLIEEIGGEWSGNLDNRSLTVSLTISKVAAIRKLADAIRKVVGRGRCYSNRNWKWISPRTADSLEIFADRLKEYRALRKLNTGKSLNNKARAVF